MGRRLSWIAVIMFGGALAVSVDARAQAPPLFSPEQFDAIDLVPTQSGADGIGLLETLGSLTDRFEPINGFRENNKYRRLGRAVGRLKILVTMPTGERGLLTCTASLIGPGRLITNYHCVPGARGERVERVKVEFFYLDLGSGSMRAFSVVPTPLEANQSLDYAILNVLGDPEGTAGIAPVPFKPRSVRNSESLFLIHHPAGQPQRLTRAFCRAHATKAVDGTEIRHLCDTLPGSSGALVFADDDFALVGIHHRGGLAPGDMSSFNRGTDVLALTTTSSQLAALVPPKQIPAAPAPATSAPQRTVAAPAVIPRPTIVQPKPSRSTPDWLKSLPVKLSDANAELLSGLDEIRKSATSAALASAEPQDRSDLEKVLAGEPKAISDRDVLGRWRCRSLQLDSLGLFIYPYFKCQIQKQDGSLILEKVTGSQRYRGALYGASANRFVFIGSWITDFDQGDMVAVLVKVTSNRMRLEIPRARGSFELSDLVR